MEKIKFNEKQYKAIKWIDETFEDKGKYFMDAMLGNVKITNNTDAIEDVHIDKVINAFIVGYEKEKTPEEEEVLEFLKQSEKANDGSKDFHKGVSFGIRRTLHLLGIEIEGIKG